MFNRGGGVLCEQFLFGNNLSGGYICGGGRGILFEYRRWVLFNGRWYIGNPDIVFPKVKKRVIAMFTKELRQQALQHVRHRVKRDVEKRIDMKFTSINALENHMVELVSEINPRGLYDQLCREFHAYEDNNDYASILKVYNQKLMLGESNVATLCGFKGKDDYIRGVLNILKGNSEHAASIRHAIKQCFGIEE